MKVSAVIPVFNRRNHITRAIDSVVHQSVPVDEILVIDDGSTDGTAEVIQSRYSDAVRLIRQPNGGVSRARRRGVEEARGEWIAFLDSDDEWTPDRNRELLQAAGRLPAGVAWIFGDMSFVTDDWESPSLFGEYGLAVKVSPQIISDSLSVIHPTLFAYQQASFIKRDVLLELNCFMEGFRSHEDVLAGIQIGCQYKFAAIPFVVAKYYRTLDLELNSLFAHTSFTTEYYRARMIAFATAIESGRRRPWNSLYASYVRGLCMLLDNDQPSPRMLALEQFRYGGFSVKGIAFMFFALTGRRGVQLWNAIAAYRRRILRRRPTEGPVVSHRRYREALVEKYWHS